MAKFFENNIFYFLIRVVFSKRRFWSFFQVLVVKNWVYFRILHEILSGNQLWLIFFGPLFGGLGGVKVEKVKILTKTLKMVKYRQFWVFLIGKRPKMITTKFYIRFWDENFFMVWTLPAPAYFVIFLPWSLGNFLWGWSPAETFHMKFFLFSYDICTF